MAKHYGGHGREVVLARMWFTAWGSQWLVGFVTAALVLLTTSKPETSGVYALRDAVLQPRQPWFDLKLQVLSGHLSLVSALLVTVLFAGAAVRLSPVVRPVLRVTLVISQLLGITIAFVMVVELAQRAQTPITVVSDATLALLATALLAAGDLVDDDLLARRIAALKKQAAVAASWNVREPSGRARGAWWRCAGWGTALSLVCVLLSLGLVALIGPAGMSGQNDGSLLVAFAGAMLAPGISLTLYGWAAVTRFSSLRETPPSTGFIASGVVFAGMVALMASQGAAAAAVVSATYLLLPWIWTTNGVMRRAIARRQVTATNARPTGFARVLASLSPAAHFRAALADVTERRRARIADGIDRELADVLKLANDLDSLVDPRAPAPASEGEATASGVR